MSFRSREKLLAFWATVPSISCPTPINLSIKSNVESIGVEISMLSSHWLWDSKRSYQTHRKNSFSRREAKLFTRNPFKAKVLSSREERKLTCQPPTKSVEGTTYFLFLSLETSLDPQRLVPDSQARHLRKLSKEIRIWKQIETSNEQSQKRYDESIKRVKSFKKVSISKVNYSLADQLPVRKSRHDKSQALW